MTKRAARVAALLTLAAALAPAVCVAAPAQKKVLVVYSTRRETQMATIGDRDMPAMLRRAAGVEVDYYSEHIDAVRFPDLTYRHAFRDYVRLKYRGMRFDALVGVQQMAYDFVAMARDELFPGTPIVFLSQDSSRPRIANAAGVRVHPDFRATIALAAALQPDTTDVFVVGGSSARDRATLAPMREQFAAFEPPLRFTYLTGLTTAALEQRVGALPPHAIVYYAIFYQDADGTNVDPLEYLRRLTEISNRPVYSWVTTAMDRGIVGGSLVDIHGEIAAVAALAGRVLRGEGPDAIPETTEALQASTVDWRQLERWQLTDARVPAGTLVQFREPTAWQRDRDYIVAGAGLLLVQTLLLVALVLQAARRRRAEEAALGATLHLRRSYDRIRDLGRRLLGAQEAERSRIGRELHDDISQQLTLLAIDLDLLAHAGGEGAGGSERLARAQERAADVAASVHQLSHELHPAKLRLVGLVRALAGFQSEAPQGSPRVSFAHANVPSRLDDEVMVCVYRVAQEALQNAIKHSGAEHVVMTLTGRARDLTLLVADDGGGFDVDAAMHHGLGLISMRERLEPFDGVLRVFSAPGHGTRIEAVVPLPEGAAAGGATDADAAARRTA